MTEETRCSLAASDKGSYHREWPSEPSSHEESIGASRQNILRTEERGLLNVWTDFNGNSDSLTLYRQRFSLRKTHFLPLKRVLKCYGAKCH